MIHKTVFVIIFVFESAFCALHPKWSQNFDVYQLQKNNYTPHEENKDNFTEYLSNGTSFVPINDGSNRPDYWDWREKGYVSPVKDQGGCNACWAFTAVACIESHLAIYRKQKVILSEQFLIDCVQHKSENPPKCGPYSLLKTYSDIVSDFGGVLKKSDYRPYSAKPGKCKWTSPFPRPIPVIGYQRVQSNEEVMAQYIYKYGPLSAAINAASMAKYGNSNNAIDEPTDKECSPHPSALDHTVLIVGYSAYVGEEFGKKKVVPYWIIKNSWGKKWGDDGFYYLVRGRNACGIANDVSFANV